METKTAKSYGYQLLEGLPKGTTLYTVLRRVSRSGMTRILGVKLIQDNKPVNLIVQEFPRCARDGDYKVTGCGIDMGFWLVYELGQLVHQDGYYFNQNWV